jgi:hypothetical protein
MLTPIQRRNEVIKCISQTDPLFDNFYKYIIMRFNTTNNKLTNSFNIIKNNLESYTLRAYLSFYDANNLCFELLYKKLIDPSFNEDDFVEFIQYS